MLESYSFYIKMYIFFYMPKNWIGFLLLTNDENTVCKTISKRGLMLVLFQKATKASFVTKHA